MNNRERLIIEKTAVLPLKPRMQKERTAALNAQESKRGEEISIAKDIVSSISKNPDLMIDPGFRSAGLVAAMTIYTREMYRKGNHPGSIFENKLKIRERSSDSRKGTADFINIVGQLIEPKNRESTPELVSQQPVQMQSGVQYPVGEAAGM